MRVPLPCLAVALMLIASGQVPIARAVEPCDAPNLSQAELNDCYGEVYKQSDAKLNAFYRQIESRLRNGNVPSRVEICSAGVTG